MFIKTASMNTKQLVLDSPQFSKHKHTKYRYMKVITQALLHTNKHHNKTQIKSYI